MLRIPLRAVGGLRSSVFFSDGPSTSRVSDTFTEQPDLAAQSAESTSDFADKSNGSSITETKSRIRQWREKVEIIPKPNSQRILDTNELQKLIDREENIYHEQVDEIARILSDVSSLPQPETIDSPPTLSQIDEEIKKKTGKVKFRRILYNEGELDGSDLEKPPSLENPHPFDPATCSPPIFSRTIAPYVNKMPILQTLVDLGVNLFEIDTSTNCGKFLLRLDHEKDIKPKIQWLVSIGFEPADIGDFITRNPFFLLQDLNDMKNRVNYLEMMKFKPIHITKIIKEFRYWINTDVKTIDSRLGWIQNQFYLKGHDVRNIITKEPRIVMFGLGPLKRIFDYFHKECLFTMPEIKRILIEDPRVFMMDHRFVQKNYLFVYNTMKLGNAAISRNPFILRCSFSSLKNRHEFLRKVGRAYYAGQRDETLQQDVQTTDLVSMVDFLHPSDSHFASRAAKSYLAVYDRFLRSN